MKNRIFLLSTLGLVIITITIFYSWFLPGVITGGDFWTYYPSMFADYSFFPQIWAWSLNVGLGQFGAGFLWNYVALSMPITFFGSLLHMDWAIFERISYLYPLLILLIISPAILFYKIFSKNNFIFFSSFIFAFNTYILMLIGGGQIFIALAYAIAPLVLYSFISLINNEKPSVKNSCIAGLLLAMQIMLDLRIGYIIFLTIGIYWFIQFLFIRKKFLAIKSFPYVGMIPGVIVFLIHAFWIIPILVFHQNPIQDGLGSIYLSIEAVRFFSFAKFENSISLLHPNWPENLFGKVSFMRPEYLLLPILAYTSLLFVNKKSRQIQKTVLFFVLLGLLGSFLAKGANEPFGQVYIWMFQHLPGFIMFRDATKFYLLIALSYSVLIPFSISEIYIWLTILNKKTVLARYQTANYVSKIFIVGTVVYFLFLIRPAIFHQLTGTFQQHAIPQDYIALENFLNQPKFFRTLWIPSLQRYAFTSSNHPAVSSGDIFNTTDPTLMIQDLRKEQTKERLQKEGIKYVIIPFDSEKEIFIKNRKYSKNISLALYSQMKTITWLKEINGFGEIKIFEVPDTKDHFWIYPDSTTTGKINFTINNHSQYRIQVVNAKKGDFLVFSEGYDAFWKAKDIKTGKIISSQNFQKLFNSFSLSENGTYDLNIYYQPQILEDKIFWVSLGSFVIVAVYLLFYFFGKKFVFFLIDKKKLLR